MQGENIGIRYRMVRVSAHWVSVMCHVMIVYVVVYECSTPTEQTWDV